MPVNHQVLMTPFLSNPFFNLYPVCFMFIITTVIVLCNLIALFSLVFRFQGGLVVLYHYYYVKGFGCKHSSLSGCFADPFVISSAPRDSSWIPAAVTSFCATWWRCWGRPSAFLIFSSVYVHRVMKSSRGYACARHDALANARWLCPECQRTLTTSPPSWMRALGPPCQAPCPQAWNVLITVR